MVKQIIFSNEQLNNQLSNSGLKKVAESKPTCTHPQHNPPMFIKLESGDYEHTCPLCGNVTKFTVNSIMY